MDVLVAKEVYKDEVAIGVFPTFCSRFLVMHMQFFSIEECVLANWTESTLLPGEFLFTGWEIFGLSRVSLLPVVLEGGIVW